MSTPITLTVGNITLTYNQGHIGIDHGALFQERDRQRRRSAGIDDDNYKDYPERGCGSKRDVLLPHAWNYDSPA